MNRFLLSVLLFFILSGMFFTLTFLSLNYKVLNKTKSYEISPSTTTIFLGHSHAECSYNDSIIPNSINLASSGEAYFYTYLKLKSILKHNSHIERLVIEFSNNQISQGMDNWTWDSNHISRFFPNLAPSCSFKDHRMLFFNSPASYLIGFQKNLNLNLKKLTLNSYFYDITKSGGFIGQETKFKSRVDSLTEVIDYSLVSETNIEYLQKIIKLASDNSIKVDLIRSPTWNTYHFIENEKDFQKIRHTKFANTNFIDLQDFFSELKYFRDPEHLNNTGATELSEYFRNNLN